MKIFIISDAIYPYHTGGKEKRIFEISKQLTKSGNEVHIFTMKWWSSDEKIRIENGVTIHAISPLYPLYHKKKRSIKQAIAFSLACLKLLTHTFDIIDVDNVPFFPIFIIKLVCILKNKKLIVTWQEVWGKEYWQEYLGNLGFFAYLIEKLSAKLPDKIISVSEHTARRIAQLKPLCLVCTVPGGINEDDFSQITPSVMRNDIIFAGRLLKHKNIHQLIGAVCLVKKKLPSVTCLIIGEGPEKKSLMQLRKLLDLEKNILFRNFTKSQHSLFSLIKAAQVFVLPSEREGFSLVTLEANILGVPVITTNYDNNAAKDLIIHGKNGYVCNGSNIEIAQTIEKILLNMKHPYSQQCTSLAKRYSWQYAAKETERIYKL